MNVYLSLIFVQYLIHIVFCLDLNTFGFESIEAIRYISETTSMFHNQEQLLLKNASICYSIPGWNEPIKCIEDLLNVEGAKFSFHSIFPECNYTLGLKGIQQELWIFSISSKSCDMRGTTFDAIAYDREVLVNCKFHNVSRKESLYVCSMHPTSKCIHITVLLQHENYAAYADEKTVPKNIIVSDDDEICEDVLDNARYNFYFEPNPQKIILPDRSRYITVSWENKSSEINRRDVWPFSKESGIDIKAYGPKTMQNLQLTSYYSPTIRVQYNSEWKFSPFPMKYVMFGSSHMRYLFDSLRLFNLWNVTAERKHKDLKRGEFEFVDTFFPGSLASRIKEKCAYNTQKTFIVQSGSWEISYGSFRLYLKTTGLKIVQTLRQILTDNISCPGLEHVVWLTTPPHPYCFRTDNEQTCKFHQKGRNNKSIAAANNIMLVKLLKNLEIYATRRLTILDAFGIIMPRLAFRESVETVCLMHYGCTLKDGNFTLTPGGAAVLDAFYPHAIN